MKSSFTLKLILDDAEQRLKTFDNASKIVLTVVELAH